MGSIPTKASESAVTFRTTKHLVKSISHGSMHAFNTLRTIASRKSNSTYQPATKAARHYHSKPLLRTGILPQKKRLSANMSTTTPKPESQRSNTIGFIGLGAMGNHMVKFLLPTSYAHVSILLTLGIAEQPCHKIQIWLRTIRRESECGRLGRRTTRARKPSGANDQMFM